MSQENNQDLEAQVDALEKDPKALADTLQKEFEQETGDGNDPENNQPAKNEDPSDPNGAGYKPAEPGEPNPAEKKDPAGTKDPAPTGDDPKNPPAKSKADRMKELLSDKNQTSEKNADLVIENQQLKHDLAEMNAKLDKIIEGKSGDGTGDGDDPTDENTPLTPKQLNELLDKREAEKISKADAEKSDLAEVEKLIANTDEYAHATDNKDEILQVMKKFPTMSAHSAYKYLQGNEIIPLETTPPSNSNKTVPSNRSKKNLSGTKKPEEMSNAELDKAVEEGINSGEITV